MKNLLRILLPVLVATTIFGSNLKAGNAEGSVDASRFVPADLEGGRVTVELKGALLGIAKQFAAKSEPETRDVLNGLDEVRVNVIDLRKNDPKAITQRFQDGRRSLESSGWARIVSVQENGDDVAIHVKTRGEESILGLCISVLGKDQEAVFVNLVGNIKPESLSKLGDKLEIPGIKQAAAAVESKESKTPAVQAQAKKD